MVAGLSPRWSARVLRLAGFSSWFFCCFLRAIGLRVPGVRAGDTSPAKVVRASGNCAAAVMLEALSLGTVIRLTQQTIVCFRIAPQPHQAWEACREEIFADLCGCRVGGCAVELAPCARRRSGFVHAQGAELVDGSGHTLMLRGTNLGNWLEPEGYMFRFGDDGPTSPREIEEYFDELIGPDQAATFWREYRDVYITKADIDFLKSTGINSVRVPIHYKFFTAE